jgi:endoglucanase
MKKSIFIFLTLLGSLSAHTQTSQRKIPIDPQRWYQLNNLDFKSNGLVGLFDGIIDKRVNTGYGKVLKRYDSYYPLKDGEEMTIDSVKFYDGLGNYANDPMILSVITDKWKRIPIAKFEGKLWHVWVGPDPDNPFHHALKTPAKNIRYLVINSTSYDFPDEIELYGTYKAGKHSTPAPQKKIQLKQNFGVNAFEWDFEAPQRPGVVDDIRMKVMICFRRLRHYIDWQKLEGTEGSYTFNPTSGGGWNYDAMYERCKIEGIEVLACIKTIPTWIKATYPDGLKDSENVPVDAYGKNFSDPRSYLKQAKLGFQFAARYGSNKNIDPSLLKANTNTQSTGNPPNVVKIGLGLIKYIECDNERDKWWKGRKAYQTGREYAANLSAFYDGHKNTMGKGVGVKNADPNMKVVMAGLAGANIDYVKGMVDWCKEFRGYKTDGKINLCWDVINYHYYPNNHNTVLTGGATRGVAPEIAQTAMAARMFTEMAHQYAYDMPVWVTETGYDINQGSPAHAIPIGNKTAIETQADWNLRTALLYARCGIEGVFFYEAYDDVPGNPGKFSTMGFADNNGPTLKIRRPAADYFFKANKLIGEYYYKETIHNDPIVDRYELNGKSAYVLLIPDEKGRTAEYSMDLGKAASAKIYTPQAGQDSMNVQAVKTKHGKLTVTVTETPIFIVPGENKITGTPKREEKTGSAKIYTPVIGEDSIGNKNVSVPENNKITLDPRRNSYKESKFNIYPNPTSDYFFIEIQNKNTGDVSVNVFAENGNLCRSHQLKKTSDKFREKISIARLPYGLYLIEIIQGNEKIVKKIIKSHLQQ